MIARESGLAEQVQTFRSRISISSGVGLIGWLTAAGLAGGAIRGYQLRSQILADDEWHAVHKLLDDGYLSIAIDFGFYNHSIGLTLFYRLMADTSVCRSW